MSKTIEYKQAIKAIEKTCVQPIATIIQICGTQDTDANKILAIKMYCSKILTTINETVERELK